MKARPDSTETQTCPGWKEFETNDSIDRWWKAMGEHGIGVGAFYSVYNVLGVRCIFRGLCAVHLFSFFPSTFTFTISVERCV